jgi:hypothetical protein
MEQLIGEVARKHGLLLSRDDSVLVSVTLNEQILSHALGQLRGSLEQAGLPRIAIPVSKLEPGAHVPAFELVGAQRRPG